MSKHSGTFVKFDKAKAGTQALKAMQLILQTRHEGESLVKSKGTERNYTQCLKGFAQYIKDNRLGDLRHMTRETAERFLHDKADTLKQKTLDLYRQAAQAFFTARDNDNKKLEIVKSETVTQLEHRAYTAEQVQMVAGVQSERYAFATRLAYATGLRAHELFTLKPIAEQKADIRRYEDGSTKTLPTKWSGREEGVAYTVKGKGGLIREVRIPQDLARELESHRLETPRNIDDRGVMYKHCLYDIAGGKKWSDSFSKASVRALGWSTGAHGLRHSYAQERMHELTRSLSYEHALATVSQEMGHWRPSITEVYLR